MKSLIKINKLWFFALFGVNLLISALAFSFLPERYFNDTEIIIFDKYHEIGWVGSYPFTMMFYSLTKLKYLPFFLIALIQFPICVFLLYKIGVPSNFHKITVKNLLVYISFFLMAIFLSMPSKEFINFMYISLIPFIFLKINWTTLKKVIVTMLFLIFFGAFYRTYYVLIPIITIGMYYVTKVNFKNKATTSIFYGIIIIIFLSIAHGIVKGKHMSESNREALNTERTKDNNSAIVSPLSTSTWYGETVGIIYGFFEINIPIIEGFKHILSPQIISFIIWQLLLFYILLVRLARCLKEKKNNKDELWILLILFSYFIIQGLFEPDLGSAVRHKIGVFPLIYYVLYYDHFRKNI
jgi:hypothetical protein